MDALRLILTVAQNIYAAPTHTNINMCCYGTIRHWLNAKNVIESSYSFRMLLKQTVINANKQNVNKVVAFLGT